MRAAFGAEFPRHGAFEIAAGLMHRLGGGRMRMLVDCIDNLRPHPDRQRVTHAFDHQELCAGDRGCGVLAAFGANQGVDGAVNHQRGRLDRCQPLLAVA